MPLYHAYELTHAAMGPARAAARFGKEMLSNPLNPAASTYPARATAAAFDMFINATRRYGKPDWDLETTEADGKSSPIRVDTVKQLPFCDLLHFNRTSKAAKKRSDPPVLIVAPMSGHYATLLRGTVEAMLPEHEVYITDWQDARDVPFAEGAFDLDDFTDYLIDFIQTIAANGERPAVMLSLIHI